MTVTIRHRLHDGWSTLTERTFTADLPEGYHPARDHLFGRTCQGDNGPEYVAGIVKQIQLTDEGLTLVVEQIGAVA